MNQEQYYRWVYCRWHNECSPHTWGLAEERSQEFVVAFLWVSEVQGAETYCNQMYKCTHRYQTTHKIVILKRTTKSVSTHPILQYIS